MSVNAVAKRAFSREEAAVYIGASTWVLDELKRNGELTPRKRGAKTLYYLEDLDRYLDSAPLDTGQK